MLRLCNHLKAFSLAQVQKLPPFEALLLVFLFILQENLPELLRSRTDLQRVLDRLLELCGYWDADQHLLPVVRILRP